MRQLGQLRRRQLEGLVAPWHMRQLGADAQPVTLAQRELQCGQVIGQVAHADVVGQAKEWMLTTATA